MLPQSSRENRSRNHAISCPISSNISKKNSSDDYRESGDKKLGTKLDNYCLKVSPYAKSVSESEDSNQIQEFSDSQDDLERNSGLNDFNCHKTRTSRVLSLSEKKRILNVKDHIELIDLTRQHQSGQQGQLRRASPPLNPPVPLNLTTYHAKNYPQKYHEVQLNRRKIQRSTGYKNDTSSVVTPKISENSQSPRISVPNDFIDDSLSDLFLKIPTHSLPPMKPDSENYPGALDIALKKIEDENKFIYSQCQSSPVFSDEFLISDLESHEMEEEMIRNHSERFKDRCLEESSRSIAVKNPYPISTNAGHGRPTKIKNSPVENFQILESCADRSGDTTDKFAIEKKYISQGSSVIIDSKTESTKDNQKMSEIHSRNDTSDPRKVDTENHSSPLTRCSIFEEEPSYAHIEYADECTSEDDSKYIESHGSPKLYQLTQIHDINGAKTINANPENENISDVYIREKYSYIRRRDSESIYPHFAENPNLDQGLFSCHIQPIESDSSDMNYRNNTGEFVECAQNTFCGIQKWIPDEENLVTEEIPTHGQIMNSDGSLPQVYNKIQGFHGVKTQQSNLSFTNFLDRPESSTQGMQRAESDFSQIGSQASVKSAFSIKEFKELHKRNTDMYEHNLKLMDVIIEATEELELMQAQAQEAYTGIDNLPVNPLTCRVLANDWQQNLHGEILNRNHVTFWIIHMIIQSFMKHLHIRIQH
ncbi:Bgt-3047 [Blumeria graminis f. sp. tritici]|uniref:Bgt-3047 n=2 Tax=Blumeria graminis f. sp. tritici TaxID=62690 RepID=A0A9X9MMU7_BLUGR|nr:Bgt-3047 [Blumeria graminis f. sp. tritici]